MILEQLNTQGKLRVETERPICIYSQAIDCYSDCFDTLNGNQLQLDNIDETYDLDIVENEERTDVYIPEHRVCELRRPSNPDMDCIICFKNIRCDVNFEDTLIDDYFSIRDD